MDTEKGLFSQIKEEMQDYRLQPSDDAWSNLERSLPTGLSSVKMVWLRRMSVAAVFLAIAAVFLWFNRTPAFDNQALFGPPPTSLEVLQVTEDCEPYCLLLRVRSTLPEYYQHPVEKNT